MTIAALYDIHGNLPALNAVLAEVESLGIEQIVVGGDVAFGPLVPETLDRLLALGDRCLWLRGNADRDLVQFYDACAGVALEIDLAVPNDIHRAGAWEGRRITKAHRDCLASLPEQIALDAGELGSVLFCHGSPRSDEEIVTAATSDERLSRILSGVRQKTVVCGHTHMQFDRLGPNGIRLVNAGSVGSAYEGKQGAFWVLIDSGMKLQHTRYDTLDAVKQFRASGHPLTESFVEELTKPSSPVEAIPIFENAARQKELKRTELP